jgi:hypothetical protein
MHCPLCQSHHITEYHSDKKRQFFNCTHCQLVFADPSSHLSLEDEKKEYDLHENSFDDQGYVGFLNRLAEPLLEKLQGDGKKGLDFGCGPTPVLAHMLAEQGHQLSLYDKFYATDKQVLSQEYDFVTCTEAIEHFHTPATEWRILLELLKPNGILAIMTKLVIDKERFADWHYKNDPTHVSFFSRDSFEFLASRDNLSCQFIGSDVIILQKN